MQKIVNYSRYTVFLSNRSHTNCHVLQSDVMLSLLYSVFSSVFFIPGISGFFNIFRRYFYRHKEAAGHIILPDLFLLRQLHL